MLPAMPIASRDANRLVKILKKLSSEDQQALLAFAEFLQQRSGAAEQVKAIDTLPQQPVSIDRPDGESVVAAIRRLRNSYPMINPDHLLHETSDLMQSHMIKGRTAFEVIDDLETLFAAKYDDYLKSFNGDD